MLLSVLRRSFLDAALRTGNGTRTRIVERPARWMGEDELQALSRDLRTVAAQTLPAGALTYGVFAPDGGRLADSIVTVVYDETTGRPIAFNALALMEVTVAGVATTVLHLGLVMVDPDARGRGLSWVLYGLTCVLLFLRNGLRPLFVSNVTQVPAVVGMVSETFSDVFPRLDGGPLRDFRKLQLARAIMGGHRHVFGVGREAEFDEETFVIRNAYTGGSDDLKKGFAESAKHRDERFNAFCAARLDYRRGDDVLQIGRIDLAAASRYVGRTLPRRSLAGVAALAGLIALNRVALPVLFWLDDRHPWGELRPWKR